MLHELGGVAGTLVLFLAANEVVGDLGIELDKGDVALRGLVRREQCWSLSHRARTLNGDGWKGPTEHWRSGQRCPWEGMSRMSALTDTPAPAPLGSLVDVLLPNVSDEALDELANTTFIDAGIEVPVTAADQLFLSVGRWLAQSNGYGVILLPRAQNRVALMLAITSHVLRLRSPGTFRGPVVLAGMDIDVSDQLRQLSVQNRRRMGLADGNPLSLHRLTRLGLLDPVLGSSVRPADRAMVYFNLRVGQPPLDARPPLVVVDATSISSPATRAKALDWARQHDAAAVLVIGDIGDQELVPLVTAAAAARDEPAFGAPRRDPVVVSLSDTVVSDLVATLGLGALSPSRLSTSAMLLPDRTSVSLRLAGDAQVNSAVTTAFQCIGAKPAGPVPGQLGVTLNLFRNGIRLAARVRDYRLACTYNARPGEMPLLRMLDREVPRLDGKWAAWQTARLGSLRSSVRTIWDELDETNPKLTALWQTLDDLERTTDGSILIRCHSRAAADATLNSLSTADDRTTQQVDLWERIASRVRTGSMKERLGASAVQAQVLTGSPPPWLLSILLGIEAEQTIVLGYAAELRSLHRQGDRWAEQAWRANEATGRVLSTTPAPRPASPVPQLTPGVAVEPAALELPGVSLAEVLDAASDALDPHEELAAAPTRTTVLPGEAGRRCIPVRLDDGRTWWCVDEGDGATPVVVVAAGGPTNRAVKDLRPGDRVLVPAGEGTESIHARLVTASRGNTDVKALDLLLSQFRQAARSVLRRAPTQRDAIERVTRSGACAGSQLSHWADGSTIAPREPGDVAAVFKAADEPCPDLGLIYSVADTLRSLNRYLGRFVAAAAAGRSEEAVNQLRELIGPAAAELLDEFVIVQVQEVGESRVVPSAAAGRLR